MALTLQAHEPGHVHVDDADLVANFCEVFVKVRRLLVNDVGPVGVHLQSLLPEELHFGL
jgi:hypothetical protein